MSIIPQRPQIGELLLPKMARLKDVYLIKFTLRRFIPEGSNCPRRTRRGEKVFLYREYSKIEFLLFKKISHTDIFFQVNKTIFGKDSVYKYSFTRFTYTCSVAGIHGGALIIVGCGGNISSGYPASGGPGSLREISKLLLIFINNPEE